MYINTSKIYCAIIFLALTSLTSSATTIELSYEESEFSDPQGLLALAGFEEASQFWESMFTDDITVNLDISFAELASGIIGSAYSSGAEYDYDQVRNALVTDASSDYDTIATDTGNLSCEDQGGGVCSRSFLDSEADGVGGAVPGVDDDGTKDNNTLWLTQANAKALGLATSFLGSDASITFSSDFSFDFDSSDGINGGQMDFVGVAIHEIGHALGFISGVDLYDYYYNSGSYDGVNLDYAAIGSTLDLFRYSEDSTEYGNVLDWRPGADSYLSIDGGTTFIAPFSTGSYGGDGHQASHFKDDLDIGIMDPTLAYGEFADVTSYDLLAFDVIGWDLATTAEVPEPNTLAIFALTLIALFVHVADKRTLQS